MKLVVISHKICWPNEDSPTGYATDGGFPVQMAAISELFTTTEMFVPCDAISESDGLSPILGRNMSVRPLTTPRGNGFQRKLAMIRWVFTNGPTIWNAVGKADAVHAPIPGDVGTIGMIFALMRRKRLFVRHCGNWLAPGTIAERAWKWSMERFAGGRNVMLATGGSSEPPSKRNSNVRWIFSTSLAAEQIRSGSPRELPLDGELRLVIACRQEERKGTDIVIAALPLLIKRFEGVSLDVIGSGSLLNRLKKQADELGISTRVKFHGKVPQSEVIKLLRKGHVFCYPTSASEGFPKVVLEALAAGLPVITTKVSVLPTLLKSGCGVLLDDASPKTLADAVTALCTDAQKFSRMSRHALETAGQYSLDNWRDSIGEILQRSWNVDRQAPDGSLRLSKETS